MPTTQEQIRELSRDEPTERLFLRIAAIVEEYELWCIGMVEELQERVTHAT